MAENVQIAWSSNGTEEATVNDWLDRLDKHMANLDAELANRKPETKEEREARYATLSNERPPSKGCRCIQISQRESAIRHDQVLDEREAGTLLSPLESIVKAADEYAFKKVFGDLKESK